MDLENTAANADAVDVAAPEGVAAPEETNQLPTSPPEGQPAAPDQLNTPTAEPGAQPQTPPDVTQTQAFAYRLKEETARIEQEAGQKARDTFIAEQGYEWNGRKITTEAEYNQALREQEIQQRYHQQGLPEDVIAQLTKVDELERWRQDMEKAQQRQRDERDRAERTTAMYRDFLKDFPQYTEANAAKNVPPAVFAEGRKWLETNGREGRRLSDAMYAHLYRQNVQQQQTQQANAANAQSSTGSVRGPGAPATGTITRETYEQNKNNQSWLMKNYDLVIKSMPNW